MDCSRRSFGAAPARRCGSDTPGRSVSRRALDERSPQLLSYIGLTLGLSGAATVAALISLRLREGAERVPIPGYPWVQVVFVVAVLGFSALAAQREPIQAVAALLTLAMGVPVYYWLRSRGGLGSSASERVASGIAPTSPK